LLFRRTGEPAIPFVADTGRQWFPVRHHCRLREPSAVLPRIRSARSSHEGLEQAFHFPPVNLLMGDHARATTVSTRILKAIGRVKKIAYEPLPMSSDRWKFASTRFP